MPGEPGKERTGWTVTGKVPLYLVPKIIADHIREKGEEVFLITVCRVNEHQYQIVVETFSEHMRRAISAAATARTGEAAMKGNGGGTQGLPVP